MTALSARLDELEALRAKATPGPWGLDFNEWMDGSAISPVDPTSDAEVTPEIALDDAALIVAAVNALPELVAALRAVEALATELHTDARTMWASAQTHESDVDEQVGDTYYEISQRLRRALAAVTEADR